jgi:outer membrane receptor protein involved in Fe transport
MSSPRRRPPRRPQPSSLEPRRDVSCGGHWLQDRWQAAPALAVEGGVRLDRSGVNGDTQLSPRVSTTWNLDSRTRLRAALGRYT